jgi:tRNA A37 N6-isopentenylltransferase MiaA
MPHTLIVLIGPTGVGKTELSLSIAEHFKTSIVSSDSRQLYADLKIGLQKKFKHDRNAYTEAKGEFIRKCVKAARNIK